MSLNSLTGEKSDYIDVTCYTDAYLLKTKNFNKMRRKSLVFIGVIVGVFLSLGVLGQTVVTYNFSTITGLNESAPGITVDANIGFGSFKNSASSNPAIFSDRLRLYQNATKGGSIKIYANNGVTITKVVVKADDRTGPAAYSVDGVGSTDVTISAGSYTLSGFSATSEIEFWQKDGNSGNRIYVEEFEVTYTTGASTPAISVSTASLDFEKVYTGFTSISQEYTVSGSDLTADIVITAPTGMEVSTSCNSSFGSSTTLTQTAGTVNATTIYARYTSGVVAANITHTSAGATTKNIAISEFANSTNLPGTYYNTATGTGATLKTSLYNIINGHTVRTYTNILTDFISTDEKPNGKLWDMYSTPACTTTPSYEYDQSSGLCGTATVEGDCWNREHAWPNSWFGGINGTDGGVDSEGSIAYTDEHHIVPTDGLVNYDRSAWLYGDVTTPGTTYSNGSILGTGSISGGYSGTYFEPIDDYKGDFARMYFYMITRYEVDLASWESRAGMGDWIMDGSTYPGLEQWYIDKLVSWHTIDPVSQKEKSRNDAIYSLQGNRNPYIDDPTFVDLVWGTNPALVVSPTSLTGLDYIDGAGPSAQQSFDLSGVYLDGTSVTVTAPTNFEVCLTVGGTYTASINVAYTAPTLSATTIYVKLKTSLAVNTYSGNITANDNGTASDVTVAIDGEVSISSVPTTTIPYSQPFTSDLDDCSTYNVSGATKEWIYSGGVAQMNGYNTGDLEEDWLIIPGIDFDSYSNEEMTFNSEWQYGTDDASNYIKLLYSSDYSGSGDPTSATWTELSFTHPSSATTQTASDVIDLTVISGTNVYIAFKYNYNSGSYRRWDIDDILIQSVVPTPDITVSTSTLTGFSYILGSGPSTEQSFTIEGSDLTTDISIVPPTNYEISTGTGGSFSATNPITLTQAGGSVVTTTIYVRLKAGLTAGDYNSEDITATSTGATDETVTCDGTVGATTLTVSETTLTGFTYSEGTGPSAEQSFTVEGTFLSDDISITAPTNYEISTGTGGSFSATSPITLTQTAGSVSTTTIYVRLKAGLSEATYNGEIITASSTGATDHDITCSGEATAVSTECANETFDNVGASSGSYTTVNVTGNDGGTWTATNARTDVTIVTDRTVCFKGSLTSPSLAGGIGDLTVTTKYPYSDGSSTLTIKVNGTTAGTVNISTSLQTVTLTGINTAGSVSIEIISDGAKRSAIDDLSWTCYSGTDPDITLSALADFGNVCTSTTAGPSSFTITGENLTTDDVTVAALTGFTYSTTSGGTYTSSLALTQAGGSYSQDIYVKFDPTLVQSYDGNIVIDGGGLTASVDCAATGSGINDAPSISTPTSASVTGTTTILGGDLTDTGCANVTKIGIYYSTTDGFADGTGTEVSETAGAPYSTGAFTVNVSGLTASTVYYYKAFAVNSIGTVYTTQGTFTTSCANLSLPLTEGFENGGSIPTCWSETTVSGTPILTYITSGTNPTVASADEGSYLVKFDSYTCGSGDEMRLVSPPITGTGESNLELSFAIYQDDSYSTYLSEGVTPQWSIDGSTWNDLTFYQRYSATNGWTDQSEFLPVGADDQATLYIGFLFHSQYGSNVFLDDISLIAVPTDPTIIVSETSLSGLDYTLGNGPSSEQTFTVSGTNLTNDIVLTAPTNYEISETSGAGFTNSITLTQTAGSVAETTIYVQLNSGLAVGTYNSEDIDLTSTGATAKAVTCNGEVTLTAVTDLTVGCTTNTTAEINWTAPTGTYDGVVIAIKNSSTLDADEIINGTDPTSLSANTSFESGTLFGAAIPYSFIVYKGSGTTLTIDGLTAGESYKIKAYTYSGTDWISDSNCPTTSISNLGFTEVSSYNSIDGNTESTISWTNPSGSCFDEILIVCHEASSVIATPSGDGSSYSADAAFGSGTDIGTDEFVVYKGTGSTMTITELTNDLTYYATIFVRNGTEWSVGVELILNPVEITILEYGDLAIFAVNTSGTDGDEFSIVSFKTIASGTSIDFTENGYERLTAGLWADSEGVLRFTRQNSNIIAGKVITFETVGNVAAPVLGTNVNVYLDGVLDNANWTCSHLGNGSGFNFNDSDQIWVMQGGTWTDPAGSHNATYSGNVLYGWTAIGWYTSPGYDNTAGSTIYPGCECATTNVSGLTNKSKVKYTGDLTDANRTQWIGRVNDPINWTGWADNTGYDAGTPLYKQDGQTITIDAGDLTSGKWAGYKSGAWCDCANWFSLVVPDNTINVEIPAHVIDRFDLVLSSHADSLAYCNSLEIIGDVYNDNGAEIFITDGMQLNAGTAYFNTNEIDVTVGGDITIDASDEFNTSEANFILNGTSDQNFDVEGVILDTIQLKSLTITSGGTKSIADKLEITGDLLVDNSVMNITTLGTFLKIDGNITLQNSGTMDNNCKSNLDIILTTSTSQTITGSGNAIKALTLTADKTDSNLTLSNTGGRSDLFIGSLGYFNMTGTSLFTDNGSIIQTDDDLYLGGDGSSNYALTGIVRFTGTNVVGDMALSDEDGLSAIAAELYTLNVQGGDLEVYPTTGGETIIINNDYSIENSGTVDANSNDFEIGGDYYVDSDASFDATGISITLNGAADQDISANGDIETYGNLIINKSTGNINLSDNIEADNLNLTSGLINTGANRVFVSNSTPANLNSYSISSYINGNLRRAVNISGNYDLPVGNATNYELANIDLNASTGLTYLDVNFSTFSESLDISGLGLDVGGIAIQTLVDGGFWTITPNAGMTAVSYDIGLSLRGYTNAGTNADQHSCVKRDNGSSDWELHGNHDNATQTLGGGTLYAYRRNVYSFSDHAIAKNDNNALPVELVSFTINCKDNYSNLNWITASELNNDYFEIQKSDDGYSWYSIGEIKGAGNSNSIIDYSFTDEKSISKSYYRLKQVDYDGKFEYSDILVSNCYSSLEAEIVLYPNPGKETINIAFENWKSESLKYEVLNMLGQTILSSSIANSIGYGIKQISIVDLKSGIYIIRIYDNQQSITKKFEKK